MSNVRQHKAAACTASTDRSAFAVSSGQRPRSFLAAHLNRQPEPLGARNHESQLEAALALLPSSNPRFPRVCRLPSAVRSATGYEAVARTVGSSRQEIREEPLVVWRDRDPRCCVNEVAPSRALGSGLSAARLAEQNVSSEHSGPQAGLQACRLTPPSSGQPKGRFAPFGLPLMSNVRRLDSGSTKVPRSPAIGCRPMNPVPYTRLQRAFFPAKVSQ